MVVLLTVLVVALAVTQALALVGLRKLGREVSELRHPPMPPDARPDAIREPAIGVATVVPEVAAVTTDGRELDALLRDGQVLIAFTSPNCIGCEQARPALVARIAERAEAGLATVVVAAEGPARIAAVLSDYPGAAVVADGSRSGELSQVFGVSATPAYSLVEGGTVLGAALSLEELDLVTNIARAAS